MASFLYVYIATEYYQINNLIHKASIGWFLMSQAIAIQKIG